MANLTQLSPPILDRISNFAGELNLYQVTRYICGSLAQEKLLLLREHPFIPLIASIQDNYEDPMQCYRTLAKIDRSLKLAHLVNQSLPKLHHHFPSAAPFEDFCANVNGISPTISDENFATNPTRSIRGMTYDGALVATVVLNNEIFLNRRKQFENFHPHAIDLAVYVSLTQKKHDLFHKLLPHSSIHPTTPPVNSSKLSFTLLKKAAQMNDEVLFKQLLKLEDYCANSLLIELISAKVDAQTAVDPKYITLLLNANTTRDNYIANNGLNLHTSYQPGLHTALLIAANFNRRDLLTAIFEARPGEMIDRRILESIQDLFRPDARRDRLHGLVPDIQTREENHPDPTEIIQFFEDEISQRYPEGPEAPQVAVSPPAPHFPPAAPANLAAIRPEVPQAAAPAPAPQQPQPFLLADPADLDAIADIEVVLDLRQAPPTEAHQEAPPEREAPQAEEPNPSDLLGGPSGCNLM